MSDTTGRTGFRVTHTKAVGERRAIVHEMMRELDPKAVEYWARENTNIVVEDEVLDRGFVNDGTGRFVRATSMQEVIDYGQSRVDRLSSPLREDKPDKKGKMRGGTVTTSMFVAHLPKSLCKEVPDFYGKGRSRWIARDRDEAMRYFTDVLRFLGKNVIPGGFEAILGFDVQHSETTPHVQVLADTFADDPKHEGQLRPEWSRAYAAHRDVKREDGKMLTGRKKLERYQDDLKAYMVARGWPVERDVDPLRHDKTATKAVYGAMKDKERALAEQEQKLVADIAAANSEIASEIEATVDELAGRWEALNAERAAVESEREQLQKDKQKALEEARTQGYADGFKEAHTQGYAKGFEEGRAAVEHERERLSNEWTTLRSLEGEYDSAIAGLKGVTPALPSEEEMRKFVREESPSLAMRYLAYRDVLLRENGKKPFHRESFERFALSRLGEEWKEKWTEPSQANQAVLDAQHRANDLRGKSAALAEPAVQAPVVQAGDGPEFG